MVRYCLYSIHWHSWSNWSGPVNLMIVWKMSWSLLLKFLLGFEEGVLLGFTHWCFGNVGRGAHVEVVKGAYMIILGSGLQKECKIQILRWIFRPRFEACISGNIQLIDLKLKTLVAFDVSDRWCSFIPWGCRIDAVLFRHLARSKCRAKRFLDQVMSQCRLFPCRCKNLYK